MKTNTHSKFKETDMGLIPEEWEISSIGANIDLLTDYHANGSYKKLKENVTLKDDPDYAIMIRTTNFEKKNYLNNLKYVDKHAYEFLKKSKVFPDDILMNKIANAGSVYIMPDLGQPVSLAMNLFLLRMNQSVNQRFVFYYLKNYELQLKSFSEGTAAKTITKDNVRNFPLILPSLIEQNKIAEILTNLDTKIEIKKKMNQTLEEIGQAIFKHWFVHFEFPNEEGKPYKSTGGEMVDSGLGEIPHDWKAKKIGDIVSRLGPGTNHQPERVENGIPFLNVRNINDGFLKLEDSKHISKKDYEWVHKTWKPEEHDVLITRIGTLGNVAIIRKQDLPLAVHYNIINVKPGESSYAFLYFLFKSAFFQNEFHLRKQQTVQEYIRIDEVENILIAFPPEKTLKNLECILICILELVEKNYSQNIVLSKIRDNILPKLISGKIRVPLEEK